MSQGRPSQSPAGPSRLPIYLTGAPLITASPSSSTRSPRVSASNRHGVKRSSAFQSFDAPAYCNDMAQYIAEQLSANPKRLSKRDQEVAAGVIEDRWRGGTSKENHTELADVSVQTTVDEEESIFGINRRADVRDDKIDISRTQQKMAEADQFLQLLQGQPDDLTEAEKGLEEQVLSIFAAEGHNQSTEADTSVEGSDEQPEVAAHIAEMLAEKEKSKPTGPLIEEVEALRQDGSSSGSSSEQDEESESEDEESSEQDVSEDEDGERKGLTYDERREALMQENALPEEVDELDEEMGDFIGNQYDDEDDIRYANAQNLYQDDYQARPPATFDGPIEVSDSDEEDEQEDGYEEDEVEEKDEEHHFQMEATDSDEEERPTKLTTVADENGSNYFATAEEDSEARPNLVAGFDPYDIAAPVLDVDNAWTNEGQMDAVVDQEDIVDRDAPLAFTQETAAAAIANLFEQPNAVLMGYSDGISSFAPLRDDTTPPQSPLRNTAETLPSPAPEAEEAPAPHILPHLQHAGDGADLLFLKQHLATKDVNISQAASLLNHPGTPQRAISYEQPREPDDGHARHASDLFQIKSAVQGTLDNQASLATSLASDIHSAPHHSDVGSVGDAQTLEGEAVAEAIEYVEPEVNEEEIHENMAVEDQGKERSTDEDKIQAKEDLADDLVDYAEHSDVAMESSDAGDDIDIQSFTGSHRSDHVYGLEDMSSLIEPAEMHFTVIEEEDEEDEEQEETQEQGIEQSPSVTQEVAGTFPEEVNEDDQQQDGEEVIEKEELAILVPIDLLEIDHIPASNDEQLEEGLELDKGRDGETVEVGDLEERLAPADVAENQPEKPEVLESAELTEEQSTEIQLSAKIQEGAGIQERDDEHLDKVEEDAVVFEEALKNDVEQDTQEIAEDTLVDLNDADEEQKSTTGTPRRSGRTRRQTTEPSSPTITRQSLRKSQSRAPSEAPAMIEPEVEPEITRKTTSKPKRNRRSRTATVESPSKPRRSSRQSVPRALSEAASESSPRKHKHHHRKSDASGDLADFVPEQDQEESEPERPTKRHKMEVENIDEDKTADVADADEEMLDTSILEEDDTQMQLDDQAVEEEPLQDVESSSQAKNRPARKPRSTPRKSTDPSFRVQKVEESDSDEDKAVKARKHELTKKRNEADREHRRELRDAKRQEKELDQKEEKEAGKAAAGLSRKARVSGDVKSYKPKVDEVADEEAQEKEVVPPEETIAKRRSKRKVA